MDRIEGLYFSRCKQVVLETGRLIIRQIQRGDEAVFAKMAADGSLLQIGFDENCVEWIGDWIEEAEALTIKDNPRADYIPCTVVLKENGAVIGSVGSTYYEDTNKVGIAYFIGAEYRNNGYMTEAIKAYVPYFFEHYGEPELLATISDSNVSSWKVAEAAGFKLKEIKVYKDINDKKDELYRFYFASN